MDFTEQVKSVVANFGGVVRVEGNDIVMPANKNIDNALFYKLKTVLQLVAQRNIAYNRGLPSGKIDRTRLYRAPTSGAIFNFKKTHYQLHNDIVLLVDCTGSMAEPNKWAKTEVIYQTLFMALLPTTVTPEYLPTTKETIPAASPRSTRTGSSIQSCPMEEPHRVKQ